MADTSPRARGQAVPRRRVRVDLILGQICKPEPSQGRVQSQREVVEHELTFDADLQLTPALLEFPSVEAAIGRQAKVDAADVR